MTPLIILISIIAYFVVLFTVSHLASRQTDNDGFFTGNRKAPWPIVAIATMGAAISGVTFISVPGMVAAKGYSYLQMVLGFIAGYWIIAFVLVPLFYRRNLISIYGYLGERFGLNSYRTGAWFFFISKMLGASVRFFVVCIVIQALVCDPWGIPFSVNVAVTVSLVWLYTFRGGVKSLIWTDTLKSLCLILSVALCIYFIADNLDMPVTGIADAIGSHHSSKIFFFEDPAAGTYFWKQFIAGIFMAIALNGLDQDMMQRNMSCPTPRDAQKNIVTTAVCQIFVILLFLVLGVLLYRYAETTGLALPAKSDQVFPLIAVGSGLPLVVGILFVIGMVSSTYSAAGASLTALTTSFTVDLLDGPKRFDDARLTRVRRRVHAATAVAMALLILAFGYCADDSVINLVFRVAGYTYGPILGMFVFGMATRRRIRDRWMPLVAVLAPVLSVAVQIAAREWWGYDIGFELLIYNAGFTIVGMLLLMERNEK